MKIIKEEYYHEFDFKKLIEGGTSRIYQSLTDDTSCAIISGYIDGNSLQENKKSFARLKNVVRNELGLGYVPFISRWVDEENQTFDEESMLIRPIDKETAMKLGQEFEQKTIIFKDANECIEICTTPFDGYSVGDVVRRYNNTGKNVLNIEDAKDIFSRRKSGPSSMPVKGNNRPFKLSTVEECLDPRPSYFQTKRTYIRIL